MFLVCYLTLNFNFLLKKVISLHCFVWFECEVPGSKYCKIFLHVGVNAQLCSKNEKDTSKDLAFFKDQKRLQSLHARGNVCFFNLKKPLLTFYL